MGLETIMETVNSELFGVWFLLERLFSSALFLFPFLSFF